MIIPNTDIVFDALQYHIHASTDHELDGKTFGADMHIVHKNRNGDNYAVLGMFIEGNNDEDTGLFDVLIEGLEAVAEETALECANNSTNTTRLLRKERRNQEVYNPYLKLPANYSTYYYSGSLTTPPCSEVVTWNVVDIPISLSAGELDTILGLILDYVNPETCQNGTVAFEGSTSRPVQPLNGRTITHKCPTGSEVRFEDVTKAPASSPVKSPVKAPSGTSAASSMTNYMLVASAAGLVTLAL